MAYSHQYFDHTADLGFSCRGDTRAEAIRAAVDALYGAIGELKPVATDGADALKAPFLFESRDPNPALRLRDLLAELLLRFECDHRLLAMDCQIEDQDDLLRVKGNSLLIDPDASRLAREVKAVTYHDLELWQDAEGWHVTVIVDI